MKTQPKPSQWVLMGSGLVLLIFSFLAFYDQSGTSINAWGSKFGFSVFPLGTFPALFGLIVGGAVAAQIFGGVNLPDDVLTFTTKQLMFILAFTGVVIMVGFLILDGPDKGIGFWLMLLGSIGLIVGAVMELLDTSTGTTAPPPPGQPGTPF